MTTPYLLDIPPNQIERNPDNPRLFFRTGELETLMISIKRIGIQVPVTVYKTGSTYTLVDGERRWRCAKKLNLKSIPALVHPKPSVLDNILLMFNIHALREQWDYLTIANKLGDVIKIFVKENKREPNETELSEATGLTRGQIRRCRLLFNLPPKYNQILIDELSLPKQSQQLSEDLFIEMERSLATIQSRVPDAIRNIDRARDAVIKKFRSGIITNITDIRKLSKIATSIQKLGVDERKARSALQAILEPNNKVGIADIYSDEFESRFDERKMTLTAESIASYLERSVDADEPVQMGQELRKLLKRLKVLIERVLEDEK